MKFQMQRTHIPLVVYGNLMTQHEPPPHDSVRNVRFRGRLYQINKDTDAAVTNVNDPKAPWVPGQLMMIPAKQLPPIIREETGYRLTPVQTEDGTRGHVFGWDNNKPLPDDAKPIERWAGSGKTSPPREEDDNAQEEG